MRFTWWQLPDSGLDWVATLGFGLLGAAILGSVLILAMKIYSRNKAQVIAANADMKQIIVMRKDLNMRKGKMIAQGAHASMGVVVRYLLSPGPHLAERARVLSWLNGPFAKVCVYVNSEEELDAVHDAAKAAGLIACMITDSGRTEFHGVPTKTCCAIGPDTNENLDPITGGLKLL